MPTSISHVGGRARVNEPGRYRKKNNKNLMAQGVPTFIGMPQPLRNLIAKRVKSSQAVTKRKGCKPCPQGCPCASPPLKGTSFEGNIQEYVTGQLGLIVDNCNPGWAQYIAAVGPLASSGENLNPSCVPSGMTNHFTYSIVGRFIDVYIFGTDHLPTGQFPRAIEIEVDKTPPYDGSNYEPITWAGQQMSISGAIYPQYQGGAHVTLAQQGGNPPQDRWSFGGLDAENELTAGMKVKIIFPN